jgi:hypothetical protein
MELSMILTPHRSHRTISGIPIQPRSTLASQRSTRGPRVADIPNLERDNYDPSHHRRKSRRRKHRVCSRSEARPFVCSFATRRKRPITRQPFHRPWERDDDPPIRLAEVIREDYQHHVRETGG